MLRKSELQEFIHLVLESELDEEDGELEEMSGCGAVGGFALPLGASPDDYSSSSVKKDKHKKK